MRLVGQFSPLAFMSNELLALQASGSPSMNDQTRALARSNLSHGSIMVLASMLACLEVISWKGQHRTNHL